MSPGTGTLLGTGGNDLLRTDDTFTTLLGGRGNDEFFGGSDRDRIEKFYGGEGDRSLSLVASGAPLEHRARTRLRTAG